MRHSQSNIITVLEVVKRYARRYLEEEIGPVYIRQDA